MSQLLDAAAGVPNACEPIPGIVTGGQPSAAHLDALRRAGCEVVLDIREPMEPQPFRHGVRSRVPERSEEHTSELQSQSNLVCRLLLEKKKKLRRHAYRTTKRVSCYVATARTANCYSLQSLLTCNQILVTVYFLVCF